jgi:hypothetical protein
MVKELAAINRANEVDPYNVPRCKTSRAPVTLAAKSGGGATEFIGLGRSARQPQRNEEFVRAETEAIVKL